MALGDLSATDRELATVFLLALGDDEFIHAERVRNWLTVAPTLEEDNVLTSIAQDEMGHARLWYELVTDHRETNIDELAIFRPAADRLNSVLVEREHTGFADTIVRSHLYDQAEEVLLEALSTGRHDELIARAEVALDEETFHREHVDRWLEVFGEVERDEDRERIRRAVETNLRHTGDLFAFEDPERLVDAGLLGTAPSTLEERWQNAVVQKLAGLPLELTEADLTEQLETTGPNGRAGDHTDDLDALVEGMQPKEIERLEV